MDADVSGSMYVDIPVDADVRSVFNLQFYTFTSQEKNALYFKMFVRN